MSLVISGFGATRATPVVLRDWIEFMGSRPREVVCFDGGAPAGQQRRLERLAAAGLIDRLELTTPGSWESARERGYIQECLAGLAASSELLLFAKLDTLPLRRGHGDWLERDGALLDDPRIFAITNSHLLDAPRGARTVGGVRYLEHDFASLNFTLVRRERFARAIEERMGAFVRSGFRGEFPAVGCAPEERRALVEWAWRDHVRAHGLVTLARSESREWMVFHINKRGRKLLAIRRAMRAGRGVEAFWDRPHGLYRPPLRAWARAGRAVEGAVRGLRRRAGIGRALASRGPSPRAPRGGSGAGPAAGR